MKQKRIRVYQCLVVAAVPLALYGFSSGPPIERTGAPVDGGLNCTACHRTFAPANSGPGRVTIRTASYTPGVKQNIMVVVEDPTAMRWGFQLTARMASDETKEAGTFTGPDEIRVRCAPDGRTAPCNGDREFAEHTQPATLPGTRDSRTFVVEWMPPAQDVGEVVMYAAGNAADNSGTPTGDHIYTTSAVVRPACNLTGKPTIGGVTDAASFRPTISSGALISIFGGTFRNGPGFFRAAASDLVDGKLPSTSFGCVAVEIGGTRAPAFFVSANQINAQAPLFLFASGPADARVILNPGAPNEIRGDAARVQVNLQSPGFFLIDKTIAATNASRNNEVISASAPAKPGDTVTLYGTGFGLSDPVFQPGEFPWLPAPAAAPVSVTIGGVAVPAADVLYAGVSSSAPGLYQINVRLPASLADGNVPVAARVGNFETQAGATIPIGR